MHWSIVCILFYCFPTSEIRQRRPPQTTHPAPVRRPVAVATPQTVPPARRGGNPPLAMSTPAPAPPPTTTTQPPQVPAEPITLTEAPTPQFVPPGVCVWVCGCVCGCGCVCVCACVVGLVCVTVTLCVCSSTDTCC